MNTYWLDVAKLPIKYYWKAHLIGTPFFLKLKFVTKLFKELCEHKAKHQQDKVFKQSQVEEQYGIL